MIARFFIVLACLLGSVELAQATVICAPLLGFSHSTRQITNPNTGNSYVLDGRGCVAVAVIADTTYFATQGIIEPLEIRGGSGGGGGGGGTIPPSGALTSSINVRSQPYNAAGDAQSYYDGAIAAGSKAFSSASATFTPTDVNKSIVVDYAGVGAGALVTTITGYVDAHHVTLATAASTTVPYKFLFLALPLTRQSGAGSYKAGDTITLAGGSLVTGTTSAAVIVESTGLVSATQNANGVGGYDQFGASSNTQCIVSGTTGTYNGGTASPFRASVNLTGGSISAINSVIFAGSYDVNPTDLTAEPVTGCGGLTGATLNIKMGALFVRPTVGGFYTTPPTDPAAQASTDGAGTGATFGSLFTQAGGFVYGTDDTAAWTAAVNAEINARVAGQSICIYAPAGHYFISAPLPIFYSAAEDGGHNAADGVGGGVAGCILGETSKSTYIYMSPSLDGDLFSWSRAYPFDPQETNSAVYFNTAWAGARVEHLNVLGDRLTTHNQNVFKFYDENSYVYFSDIQAQYINGSVIAFGFLLHSINGYITESEFNFVRMGNCGNATHPCFDAGSHGTTQGTNEIQSNQLNIYGNHGVALAIHNDGLVPAYNMHFDMLRIEGTQWNSFNTPVDLLQIGSATQTSDVNNLSFTNVELLDSYPGAATIHMNAATTPGAPYNIDFRGQIGGGAPMGKGLLIDAGRSSSFYFTGMFNYDYDITIGPNTQPIFGQFDIDGVASSQEHYTYNVDPTERSSVSSRMNHWGLFNGSSFVAANAHAVDAVFGYFNGQSLGANAVDLSTSRTASQQSALGALSTIAGGGSNSITSNGLEGVIGGGLANIVSGTGSVIPGGSFASDKGRTGALCHASGRIVAVGDSQQCTYVMRCSASSVTTCRLTSDALPASASNCLNVSPGQVHTLQINVSARNAQTGAVYSYVMPNALLTAAGPGPASTSLTVGTSLVTTAGAVSGYFLYPSADTTNGCLNLTFNASGNTNEFISVVGRVNDTELGQ